MCVCTAFAVEAADAMLDEMYLRRRRRSNWSTNNHQRYRFSLCIFLSVVLIALAAEQAAAVAVHPINAAEAAAKLDNAEIIIHIS